MLRRWKKYKATRRLNGEKSSEGQSSELIQAYRLYSLASAGSADLASMNRLREMGELPAASWYGCWHLLGERQVRQAARTLVAKAPTT